jgi:hypothetical protein
MKTLYFLDSQGNKRKVKENIAEASVMAEITSYVKELNPKYEIYYVRTWETEKGITYDVGSHTEFFLLEG